MGVKGGCIRKMAKPRERNARKKMGWLGFRRIEERSEDDEYE